MRIKSFKLFAIVILMTLIGLIVFGCGRQGSRFANATPTIQITSYEGYDPANPYTDSTEVTLFQQKIFWHAEDTDGVIAGFAYRVLDNNITEQYPNGTPISTPGNKFIDSTGEVTPDNVIAKFGTGWVMHYKPGADQDIALDDPAAKRTIWTNDKYALVNFKAANAAGDSLTSLNRFEVICVDNRGEVCAVSAFRRFTSYSRKPTCFLSTTKGDPDGGVVGTGLRLSFSLNDDDPFIQPTPWYYEFKLQKCRASDSLVVAEDPVSGWANTLNADKLNQFLLTKTSTPRIYSDFNSSGAQTHFTRAIARVVDLAGIISEPDTISFIVKEGFHPQTMIYPQRVYALGNNHYISYPDESTPEILPYTIIENEQRFATPFFRATDGFYTAVNSSNLKSWIRWGWHGEYGTTQTNGNIIITDNPYDKKVDVLLDEGSDTNYFSEITHFDIRLDGEPYNYPPLFADHQITDTDAAAKTWLRVPVNSSLGQTIVLTNRRLGEHIFEVRAVDLQGEVDPTPAVFNFKIVDPVPKADKAGILVIGDSDELDPVYALEDSVDVRYENMLSDYSGQVDYVERRSLTYKDSKLRKLALSDLQNYKLIIYHNDNVTQNSYLSNEHDGLYLYLKQGGNMMICGGKNIHAMAQAITGARQRFMETYFGLDYSLDATDYVTGNFNSKYYMIKAVSKSSAYNSMSLAFDMNAANPQPENLVVGGETLITDPNEASFVSLVNLRKGMGPLAYFLSYPTGTAIFEYGSKPVYGTPNAAPYYTPSQTDFDNLDGRTLGLKKITTNNKCYIMGFPLSYMKKADSKQFMNTIVNEVMAN